MKKLSAPLAFVLSVLLIESSSVVAQLSATPAERPLIDRIQGRTFPSAFQAWSPAQNVQDDSPFHTVARHDLVFNGPEFFGLRWNRRPTGLADGFTAESIEQAKAFRQRNQRAFRIMRSPAAAKVRTRLEECPEISAFVATNSA